MISNMKFNHKLGEQFWRIWCFPIQSDRRCTWMPERCFKDGRRVTWLVLKRLCLKYSVFFFYKTIFCKSPNRKSLINMSWHIPESSIVLIIKPSLSLTNTLAVIYTALFCCLSCGEVKGQHDAGGHVSWNNSIFYCGDHESALYKH